MSEVKVEALVQALMDVANNGNRSTKKKGMKEITTTVEKSSEVRTIIVPEGMTLLEASKELENMHKNQEQVIDVDYLFEGWDWKDSLVAIKEVSEAMFGWINGVTVKTMMGEMRPSEIDVVVDVKNGKPITKKCFYGNFAVAAWEKAIANVAVHGSNAFISIKAKKKYSEAISEYFKAIEQHLFERSIYRGKTVVVTDKKGVGGQSFDYGIIENRAGDTIVLNKEEQLVVDEFILGELGEPGKRSYLFTGPYGNGKTETAMNIGRQANNIGMAFFYVKDSSLFEQVLDRSKKYQPCIIFLEDIDEIGAGEERGERMNKILNTLDGVQTKGNSLTVIFTTNHERKINKALRRPGRIDLVVNFVNPSRDTKIGIMRTYFKKLEGADKLDYDTLADKMGDVSGSVVAQISKRATKLSQRNNIITNARVEAAILSMEYHIKLMNDDVEGETKQVQLVRLLQDQILGRVPEDIANLGKLIERMQKKYGF